MKKKSYLSLAIAALIAVVLSVTLLAGCGGGASKSNETLKFGCQNYTDSLDPSAMTNGAWACVRYGVGECLFKFKEDGSVVENLCDKYEVNDAKTEYKIHIRDGVKFSDGSDLTADIAVKSIKRMYTNEKDKKYTSTPSTILPEESIKKLEADGNGNIILNVDASTYLDVPAALANPFFVIINPDTTKDYDKKPIGTGPYAVESMTEGSSVSLIRNENYWNGNVPYAKLQISFMDDSSTKAMALKNGDANVVENITTATDLSEIKGDTSKYNVSEATSIRTGFAYMNQKGALKDADLRKAIIMAMDNDTLCNKTVGGMYSPGYGVLPDSLDFGTKDLQNLPKYDVEGAKKVLDDAGIKDKDGDGYREAKDGSKIELRYITYSSRNLQEFAEACTASMEKIGIKATVKATDGDTEWNEMVAGNYDLCDSNWMTAQTGDPYGFLENWYGKSEANYCAYNNDQYNKVFEELKTEKDTAARKEKITQLQQYLVDDNAVLVHGYYKSNMCSQANVQNANINTFDYYWITNEIAPK